MLNITRSELELRPECEFILQDADPGSFTFWDAVDASGNFQIALVDHNAIHPRQASSQDKVVAIIDHHKDDGGFPHVQPRMIQTVGSCSSLIVSMFQKTDTKIPKHVAKMLLSAIIMDTANLLRGNDRTTQTDVDACQYLQKGLEMTDDERLSLHRQLRRTQSSSWSLRTMDLLRKDYKGITGLGGLKIGTSSIGLKWEYLEARQSVFEDIQRFMQDRRLDMELILTTWDGERAAWFVEDGQAPSPASADMLNAPFSREVVILSDHSGHLKKAIEALKDASMLSHDRVSSSEVSSQGQVSYVVFSLNPRISRKVLVPALL